jgi:hypothetical protein
VYARPLRVNLGRPLPVGFPGTLKVICLIIHQLLQPRLSTQHPSRTGVNDAAKR